MLTERSLSRRCRLAKVACGFVLAKRIPTQQRRPGFQIWHSRDALLMARHSPVWPTNSDQNTAGEPSEGDAAILRATFAALSDSNQNGYASAQP
jgi:hypothetical protein